MTNKLIDLSHTVEHGMITYKGFPAPVKMKAFGTFPVRAYAVLDEA